MECESLTEKARNSSLILSTGSTSINTTVTATCADGNQILIGQNSLTCLATGKWSAPLPYCTDGNGLTDREITILASLTSILSLVILIGTVLCIWHWAKKRRRHKERHQHLARTFERISIRDPLDDLVRRESRRSYIEELGETNDDNILHRSGSKRQMYKIWTCDRKVKTFVFANDLQEVLDKGATKLGLKYPSRLVLEEDGTEIDDDDVLRACAGRAFLVLEHSDKWTPGEIILSADVLPEMNGRTGTVVNDDLNVAYL